MGIYDYSLSSVSLNESRGRLQQRGPLILIEISPTDQLLNTITASGSQPPAPVRGWGILDSGAFFTAIDKDVLASIGSQPSGAVEVRTAGSTSMQDVYPAKVGFPATDIERAFDRVIGTELDFGSFERYPIIGLIGREVLSDCIFIYNGKTGIYTLAH